MFSPGGPVVVPGCPSDTARSRATALCTEGRSLMPLLQNGSAGWGRASFSQFPRDGMCCDCPPGPPPPNSDGVCCACAGTPSEWSSDPVMGYTVRVDKYRYTGWFLFNQTAALPDFGSVVGTELYAHDEAPWPNRWDVEHHNIVKDPAHADVVDRLHTVIVKCGQRPDTCPPDLLAGLVP